MAGISGCIALIVVGAVLTFASDWHVDNVNLDVAGVIMMLAGLLGLGVYRSVLRRRRVPALPVIDETRDRT
ncbi:hypothetical protein ACM614_10870 [Streptomyces sp. 12297]|uniref:hypothetical protein n=1 Tax=Streptomyces sp. NBC_00239 TaxID=2903640 RepID=UPI002E284F16|nr:hypothetical protein [Streptomyces sp. NBC_00239]